MERYEEGKETREKQIAKNLGKVQGKKKKSPQTYRKLFMCEERKKGAFVIK